MEKNKQISIPNDKESALMYLELERKVGNINEEQYKKEKKQIEDFYSEKETQSIYNISKEDIENSKDLSKNNVKEILDKAIPKIESNPSIKSEHLYPELILPTKEMSEEQVIDMLSSTGMIYQSNPHPNDAIVISINNIIANSPIDTNLISDGKKTFGQLYNRIQELLDERDGKI